MLSSRPTLQLAGPGSLLKSMKTIPMKKKGIVQKTYRLPNATKLQIESGLFQYYRGDFFMIFATQPALQEAHEKLKRKYVEEDLVVSFLFKNTVFIFEILFNREALADYEELKDTNNLNELLRYSSLEIERNVKSFFRPVTEGRLADRFIYARVVDLILQLVLEVTEVKTKPTISKAAAEIAGKARDIILEDLSVYDTIEGIAGKIGISKKELQHAFKQRFGLTIGKFSKEERMKHAYYLLETTDQILLSIAMAVGYNDTGNFSIAFKNHFGYSPGSVQKRIK